MTKIIRREDNNNNNNIFNDITRISDNKYGIDK